MRLDVNKLTSPYPSYMCLDGISCVKTAEVTFTLMNILEHINLMLVRLFLEVEVVCFIKLNFFKS